MEIIIPGHATMTINHLVLDFNGTIARDGILMSNLDRTLREIAERLSVHIITADTSGTVLHELEGLPCKVVTITTGEEAEQKAAYVRSIGADTVICFGNGYNDSAMLQTAAIGVAVLEGEGLAIQALHHGDILCRSIYDAFGLLMVPQRIVATLRR